MPSWTCECLVSRRRDQSEKVIQSGYTKGKGKHTNQINRVGSYASRLGVMHNEDIQSRHFPFSFVITICRSFPLSKKPPFQRKAHENVVGSLVVAVLSINSFLTSRQSIYHYRSFLMRSAMSSCWVIPSVDPAISGVNVLGRSEDPQQPLLTDVAVGECTFQTDTTLLLLNMRSPRRKSEVNIGNSQTTPLQLSSGMNIYISMYNSDRSALN